MPDISEALLDKAKKVLKKKTAAWTGGVCNGTCLDLKGDEMVAPHTACHAWVGYAFNKMKGLTQHAYPPKWNKEYTKDAKQFLTLTCHSVKRSKGICSAEAVETMIHWVAHESPWSQFVLNRDDKDSLADGAILLCGPDALSHAEAMWICKTLRYTVEGAKAADTWYTLYKAGVNPILAVLVATHVRSIKGATFGYTGPEYHSSVFADHPNYEAVFAGTPNKVASSTNEVFRYEIVQKNQPKKDVVAIIKGFCKPIEKDDGWGGKVKGEGADENDLITRVLAWQAELTGGEGGVIPAAKAAVKAAVKKVVAYKPAADAVYLEADM